MNVVLLFHLLCSGVYLVIIFVSCVEFKLSDIIEAFYKSDGKGTFLFVGSLMTGFFFWLLIFFTGILLKCRKDANYFQDNLKRFGVIKNDDPIDLKQETRIKHLEDEIRMLQSDVNFLLKQMNYQTNN